MVARHFCNESILRDCEERLFHFDAIRMLYVSFDAIRILYASCNMLVSYFMRYACFVLYAIRLFHALCDTPVSYFMRYACFMLYAKSLFYAKGLALGHI